MMAFHYRRLLSIGMAAAIFIALIAGQLYRLGVSGALAVILLLALVAFAVARWHTGPLNPLRVYLLLASMLLLCIVGVVILSFLGPWGLLILLTILIAGNLHVARLERLRAYRSHAGLCVECGYDLRESADRCPECGAPLPEELLRRRRIAAALAADPPRPSVSLPSTGFPHD